MHAAETTARQEANIEKARRYLAAIEAGATGEALAAFFTSDVIQEEFPNRLMPNGAKRDLTTLLEGAERGQQVLTAQSYEVRSALASGDQVALEVLWTGTLAIPVGSLPAGGVMRARFAVFLEFRGGKIASQRNYDCYDPF
jgi:ketosteroid isomerase-like protein